MVADEQQSPSKKMRLSKRIAKRKERHVVMDPEEGADIPIIISTASLDPLETESDSLLNQSGGDVFYRTQAVMHEMLKEHPGDQTNQEIITIQTTAVDDMQVEEIVEVVVSLLSILKKKKSSTRTLFSDIYDWRCNSSHGNGRSGRSYYRNYSSISDRRSRIETAI